jgi:tetratricopeptide (TPR) repeat protein
MSPSRTLAKGFAVFVFTVAACTWTLAAQNPFSPAASLEAGDGFMSQARYGEAFDAYLHARSSDESTVRIKAGAGMIRALLRVARFSDAQREGAMIVARDPGNAAALAVYGDALWASGLFIEAEAAYRQALTIDANAPGALHGRGRSLAAQGQWDAALADVTLAQQAEPLDPAYTYTQATIFEEMRRYDDAADALTRFVALLPRRDDSDMGAWARTQAVFLRSFRGRTPYEIVSSGKTYTVPFRVESGRLLVKARVNGGRDVDFSIDTGSDRMILTPAYAQASNVVPMGTLASAGIGEIGIGYRNLQVSMVDDFEIGELHMKNVASLIKAPVLEGLPRAEGNGFSPVALGLSMSIDYGRNLLTMAEELPATTYAARLPLRMQRLPIVAGTINGDTRASFIVDTGGEVTSVSRTVASGLDVAPDARRVPVRIFGSSGWDTRAFLLPFVDIDLAPGVGVQQRSVVVLNLNAPSALLGFNLGGIIGHEFLSRYTVAIDLRRHEVGLQPLR